MRWLYYSLGLFFLALGALGAILPLLPTTPFVILSAFFFARSSPKLHNWLITHPWFSEPIKNWEERGAIPRYAKLLSSGMMTISVVSLFFRFWGTELYYLPLLSFIFCFLTALWIWSRPE